MNMGPTKKERAKGVKLPTWWLSRVQEISDERKETLGESLGELAHHLSEAVKRSPPWDHGAVSRFLDGRVTTAPMAEAFSIVFSIPRVLYQPRSWDEAQAMQQVANRYEGKRLNPDQQHRTSTYDHAIDVLESEARDQTRDVRSSNEGENRSRRARRATRRRPQAS